MNTRRRLLNAILTSSLILALLVPVPARADIIQDVKDLLADVAGVARQATTLVTRTNGLPNLVQNVTDVTVEFGTETITDVFDSLKDAKNLIGFLKNQAVKARRRSNHTDIPTLIVTLEEVTASFLGDAGGAVDLSIIIQLLAVIPDDILDLVGEAVATAGITNAMVAEIGQWPAGIDTLRQAIALADGTGALGGEKVGRAQTLVAGSDALCAFTNDDIRRPFLSGFAGGLLLGGGAVKTAGGLLDALGTTAVTEQEIGIHGYAGFAIQTNVVGTLGKAWAAIGDAALEFSRAGVQILRHCELFHYQQEMLAAQDEFMLEVQAAQAEQLSIVTAQLELSCKQAKNKGKPCRRFRKK